MEKTNPKYNAYVQILKEELHPAMGCTEPIALAYAAAVARRELGCMPDRVVIGASGSIIKNVKSVIVPNTNHLKGIPAAASAGIVAGDPDKELEVIAEATEEDAAKIKEFLENTPITVEHLDQGITFDIVITLYHGDDYAKVRIANYHTNIVLIEHNGEIVKESEVKGEEEEGLTDRTLLNMKDIWDFINTVDVEDIKEVLDRQMEYNYTIAKEGIRGDYGANIGKVLLDMDEDNVKTRAKAMAAAGSDARMNGCELPVVINSGSGNQGITVSVPVMVYAEELKVEKEKLDQILEVARLSPTACNLQRQRLKVVTSKEGIQKLRDCTPCHFKASTIIILLIEEDTKDSAMKGDDRYKFGLIDIGIVAEHMALKATELGIGSTIVGMMDADKVREMFAIPVTEHPVLLLPLGYPDEKGKPCILHASRLPIDDTVTWA